jgi:Tfp pilus assembly protein PilF
LQSPPRQNGVAALAELYSRDGQNKLAIETYEILLQLTPGDTDAIEVLKKLKEQK